MVLAAMVVQQLRFGRRTSSLTTLILNHTASEEMMVVWKLVVEALAAVGGAVWLMAEGGHFSWLTKSI